MRAKQFRAEMPGDTSSAGANPRDRWTSVALFVSLAIHTAGASHLPVTLSQSVPNAISALTASPEWTRYAFMFPVGILVATCAQTAGIGGAALMGPFFVLGLPLLGPEFALHSLAASVATAILTEAFGFTSGE